MMYIFTKIHSRTYILYVLSILFVFLLFACGQGANNPQATSPDTCTIFFDISWPESARENSFSRLKLDCARVPNIMANVYSDSGKFLQKGGPWECTTGKGIITDVPSGGKGIVTIQGMDSNENIIYRGESNVIDLAPGTVISETIEAHDFIPELKNPPNHSNAMIDECVFQWSKVQGASGYQIQVSKEDSFTSILIDEIIKDANYTNPSYIPAENPFTGQCYWRIRAKDIYGKESGWSQVWSATIFVIKTYNIQTIIGEHGMIEPSGEINVNHGTNQTFTITPDEGYQIADVIIDGKSVGVVTPYIFENVTKSHSIEVTFVSVLYVNGDISTSGNGSSWPQAFKTIQEALDAVDETVNEEIWVKQGIYYLTEQIQGNKSIAIYGGFNGTENQREERDLQNNITQVDGQDSIRCFTISSDMIIDGFAIYNARSQEMGAGIYIVNSSVFINNCEFKDNSVAYNENFIDYGGSGICAVNSSTNIDNCSFINNNAGFYDFGNGGAIHIKGGISSITGCTFSKCSAGNYGGAIYSSAEKIKIVECNFTDNSGIYGGGAIFLSNGSFTINNCTYSWNYSEYTGGGISCSNTATGSIDGSTFSANNVCDGGGAIVIRGSVNILNSIFIGNKVNLHYNNLGGAAIYIPSGFTIITNSVFKANVIELGKGGAISTNGSTTITNCTFTENIAGNLMWGGDGDGGAIYASKETNITNCILWNNSDVDTNDNGSWPEIYKEGYNVKVTYCNIDQTGYDGISGNIRQAPGFVDSLNNNFHLQPGSPCIDKGTNEAPALPDKDFEDDERIFDGDYDGTATVDMGADEACHKIELLGITWSDSRLVSFDPLSGTILHEHVQLNEGESFIGLTYDSTPKKLYALSQVAWNLYEIDPNSLKVSLIGKLNIDKTASWGEDVGGLSYNPNTNTFYTALSHWDSDHINIWGELLEVDIKTAETKSLGKITDGFCDILSYNETDGSLYGFTTPGSGSSESTYKSSVIKIDLNTMSTTELFETPYHTISGLAKTPGENIYFSWINWTSHFYGVMNLNTKTITPLANSDNVGVSSGAMIYKDFYVAIP